MTVACGSNEAIAAEQIKFYAVSTVESAVGPVLIRFVVAFFVVAVDVITVNREQIDSFIGSLVEPCKMVDSQHVDVDVTAVNPGQTKGFLADAL